MSEAPSTRPLPAKLGIKPGFAVCLLGAPAGFAGTLPPLPAGVVFAARPRPDHHLFLCFARRARELDAHLALLGPLVARQTVWLAWPKQASRIASDLDANTVRTRGIADGWVDFKVCAIDTTWSGLAFTKRRQDGRDR